MYNVYALTTDHKKVMVHYNGLPAFFDTDVDAWNFIQTYMQQKEHPLFMWIKEAGECKSSTT